MMEVWDHHLLLLLMVITAACLTMASDQDRCSQELRRLREQEKVLKLRVQKQEILLQRLQLLNQPRPHKTTANQDARHGHAHKTAANQQEPPPDGQSQHRDCSQVFQAGSRSSGVYSISPLGGSSAAAVSPLGGSSAAVSVYCDMSDGGGWTVVQRRMDGSQRFNRSWSDYSSGFGDLRSEFWLGNDLLHQLTSQGDYVLRIHLEDFEGNQRYAEYKNFTVANEEEQYRLAFGTYSGTAGDALSASYQPGVSVWASHQGMAFSTYDRDNDRYTGNCALEDQGGWWFNRCHSAHLNGLYHLGGPYSGATDHGVVWFPWRGWWYSLRTTVMKIRPQGFSLDPQRTAGTTPRP